MSTKARNENPEPVGQLSLWFGMLGGAAAWAIHLVTAYALVPLACSAGLKVLLYATIPATIVIAAAAVFFAWRGWNQTREAGDEPENGNQLVMHRVRFMGLSGLAMSTFFLAVIIAQSVPILTQNPCDPGGSIRI